MAFYKDAPGRKAQKNHSSNWADEGSEYTGARKSAHGKSGNDRSYSGKGEKGGYRKEYRSYESKGNFRKDNRRDDRRQEDKPAPSFRDHEYRPSIAPAPVTPVTQEPVAAPENLLAGRNPIREALRAGRDIEKLMVLKGELTGSAREIVQMAREQHIVVQEVEKVRLDEIARNHQGMIAIASAYKYSTVEEWNSN